MFFVLLISNNFSPFYRRCDLCVLCGVRSASLLHLTTILLLFNQFLGRFVGKAVYDRQLIDFPVAYLLLKHMVGDVAQDDNTSLAKSFIKVSPSITIAGPPGNSNSNRRRRSFDIGVGTPSSSTTANNSSNLLKPLTAPTTDTQPCSEKEVECGDIALSDDDLADFPDEIVLGARKYVSKFLLQSLLDVRTLDSILYKSLLWMINNDITDVIDETFSVAVPGSDRSGEVNVSGSIGVCVSGDDISFH